MKTYTISKPKISRYLILGMLAISVASCGTYSNSSYYDRDGIYGGSANRDNNNYDNGQKNQEALDRDFQNSFALYNNRHMLLFSFIEPPIITAVINLTYLQICCLINY